jgi:hypothetical protein
MTYEPSSIVEPLRIIHDLDTMFDNLRSARKRIREGIARSEETKKGHQENSATPKGTARVVVRASDNPMRRSGYNYSSVCAGGLQPRAGKMLEPFTMASLDSHRES